MNDQVEQAPVIERKKERSARFPVLLALATSIVLALLMYADILTVGLVGHDTYPIIAASRVQHGADFVGTFTEELMDGLYTKGRFYRPVLNLTFALDHALWGMEPFGYHLTDLVLLGLCAALLALLLRGGTSGRLTMAAGVAALFFLSNPVHLNILPVAARRGDLLAILFTLLAIHGSLRAGAARFWLPALFTLLALGSKETGALAPFLIIAWNLFLPRDGARVRFGKGLVTGLAPLGALALFLLIRQGVLGDAGGHLSLSPAAIVEHGSLILGQFQSQTCYPYPVFEAFVPAALMRVLLFLVILGATLLLLCRSPRLGVALFAWTWMILGWAIHSLSQLWAPWYPVHTVAPFALLAGVIVTEAVSTVRRGEGLAGRICAGATGLLLLVLLAVNVINVPAIANWPEWTDVSDRTDRFLADLEGELETARDGATIVAPDIPYEMPYRAGSPIFQVWGLTDYTVAAWAQLAFPGKRIRVVYPHPRPPPPAPDEILVVVLIGDGK